MTAAEAAGFLLTLLMGLTLGMIGAGGSILTVPILVFFFGLPASEATGASLAIVGGVALVGALLAWHRGEVEGRALLLFGAPSVAVAFLVRRLLVPAIPQEVGGISKDSLLLILFAVVMFGAAWVMIRGREPDKEPKLSALNWLASGVAAGLVTGLLGAGGGFIIVPVLSAGLGLSMKRAVGTSLGLIAMNAASGLGAEVLTNPSIDWALAGTVGALALVGLGIGIRLQHLVSARRLKVGFGWMIVVVAVVVLGREIIRFWA
jgi:uncharacterized membrane protein YfcA